MAKKKNTPVTPIGERLRTRRIEVLKKGLREMAALLGISPAHLTDIEKGNRSPSDDLMLRISERYGVSEAELRVSWSKADSVVEQIATMNETTATRVPEFLRKAKDFTDAQWQEFIQQADKATRKK